MVSRLIRQYILIIGLITLHSFQLEAQVSGERAILKNLQNRKWDRAHEQLRKSLKKDSANTLANYLYVLYFISPQNLNFQVDSANHYVGKARRSYQHATLTQQDRLKRFPLDSTIISRLKKKVDSTGFVRATQLNTVKDYEHFLSTFTKAEQTNEAIVLRNAAAYQDAVRNSTYQDFALFLSLYPNASQVNEAKVKYEQLLFESTTQDKRLNSYETFLREFPNTPHRNEVEQNIFEIFTAGGEEEVFHAFIKKYPESLYAGRAKQILFHLLLESGQRYDALPDFLKTDSLKLVLEFEDNYLVPFLTKGKFGFMDGQGKEVFPPVADEIPKEYICGNITDDVIRLNDKILAKNGAVIFNGRVDAVDDLGFGFLKVETQDHVVLVHKAGFIINEPGVENAKVLSGKFIAVKKEKWGLFTLSGRKIIPFEWDEIKNIENVLVFKRGEKMKLATAGQLGLLADQQNNLTNDFFDDVKPWHKNLVWMRAGNYEGVLDQALNVVVPFDTHTLEFAFFGTIGSSFAGKKIYTFHSAEASLFQRIQVSKPWLAVKQKSGWGLFDVDNNQVNSPAYDTIIFKGSYAVGIRNDSSRVYLKNRRSVSFSKLKVDFIPGKDSVNFLMVSDGERRFIYNDYGQKLFVGDFENAQYVGEGFFIISKKDQKGLIGLDGKYLIQPGYDAIGRMSETVITLLKNKKFGAYDIISRKFIKPQYDKNLVTYSRKFVVAYKDGLYGFVEWDDKKKYSLEFKEIQYWNDSVAWVKMNSQWMIYDITHKKVLHDKIKKYKVIVDTKFEKIAIVQNDDKYGVISSKTGILIPIEYSDVKNLGPVEEPLYFTEKHVEEASIFIVIYYDKSGKLIKRSTYDDDAYERIYCEDNLQ